MLYTCRVQLDSCFCPADRLLRPSVVFASEAELKDKMLDIRNAYSIQINFIFTMWVKRYQPAYGH